MNTPKTFFVTGATGNQGGATARNLAEKGFIVKALVRDPDPTKTQNLKHPNIQLVKGDLNDASTYSAHLENIDGIFCVLAQIRNTRKEVTQGTTLINSAKENKVPYFLYSSVIGADAGTGIPHWESKNQIENTLRSSGMPFTIIRPASLYENYLIPDVRKRIVKGTLVTPVKKDKVQQFICTEDVGRISAHIFINAQKYAGRTLSIAADEMDMTTAAKIFSDVLGKPIKYSRLPGILTRIFMGADLYKMFNYVNTHDVRFVENMSSVKAEFPFLTPLAEWIRKNRNAFTS